MKAVIMAGGEGSRLRPITCDCPKPLTEIAGHPVIEYIFELLIRHSCDEAKVTLKYLAGSITERFFSGKYKGLPLDFVMEERPLGTAGSVKNAADFEEDFAVISGDALCDVDLSAAFALHKRTNAAVTVVAVRVSDPREYGLVSAKGDRVCSFVEKPSFSGVTTDLANTGIYILSPKVLRKIPENSPYDFAKDLFPRLLRENERISVYVTDGYWCDIGDIKSYLESQFDVIGGRFKSPFLNYDKNGIFLSQPERAKAPEKTGGDGNESIKPGEVKNASDDKEESEKKNKNGAKNRRENQNGGEKENKIANGNKAVAKAVNSAGSAAVTENENPLYGCEVIPPVYVGSGAVIRPGAVIGPNAVIESGASVSGGARIRNSFVGSEASVGEDARLTGAVVCKNAKIGSGASLFEGCVIGSSARVGENAQIMPGVSVWPGKRVENGAVLSENLRYGTAYKELFDDDGISGDVGVDMTPEFAARLGAALAGLAPGGKIAVARGYNNCSAALSSAVLAGIVSAGVSAADIGPSPETAAAFAATRKMFSYVVYISGGEKTVIRIFAEGGLPLTREKERAVSGRIARSEFIRCKAAEYPFVSDMRAIKNLYTERLMSMAPDGLCGVNMQPSCRCQNIQSYLSGLLLRLGCDIKSGPVFCLDERGINLTVCTENGKLIPFEKLVALCCMLEFKEGKDLLIPYAYPRIIDLIAERAGCRVYRFLSCPCEGYTESTKKLSSEFLWLRDGIATAVYLADKMKRTGENIDKLCSSVPDFAVAERWVSISGSAASVMERIGIKGKNEGDGILSGDSETCILIHPSKRGDKLKVLSQAKSSETAAELCMSVEQLLGVDDNGKSR